jgi:glycosyltransferase involved in cell wall biosynthesis
MLARFATDRIVVISGQQRHEIHETFGVGRANQFVVIPLGLDTEVFSHWQTRGREFRAEFGLKENDLLVGIVGRLAEVKNHDLFLEGAALWKQKFSKNSSVAVRFVVIGDGQLRKVLSERAEALGLDETVHFAGSRRELEDIYPALDIVALTSLNEGTPLTLIEAMANARPVISTAVGGVADLLGEPLSATTASSFTVRPRGLSVPSGDAAAFAEALEQLAGNAGVRREIGERGLQFITSNYSKERLLEDIKWLYADLLKEK